MKLDLDHLKKLAMAAKEGADAIRCSSFPSMKFEEARAIHDFENTFRPATVLELIRLAEKGKACEKRTSESHLIGGVPGNHNW